MAAPKRIVLSLLLLLVFTAACPLPASAKLRDRIRKWIGRGSPAPPGGPKSKSGPVSIDKVKEVAKVVKLLAQNKEFVRMFWKGDVADLLLRALRRSNEVTLLAPSPDAAKAELPDDSPLVKSKKTMRRLLRYCLVLGRLVSYTNLVEDPAGTKYPTMYGQPQVKSAESSFFTVYFQTPSGKENSTLVAPNLFEGKFLQVHLVSDVLIPDGFFGSPSPPPEEDDPVDQTPPTETGSAGAASTPPAPPPPALTGMTPRTP
ncbi:unnamed protein product [Closterium sp. NIES-53]